MLFWFMIGELMGLKNIIKKISPSFLFGAYHWCRSYLAALSYGWPAKKLVVIGVTGTKGKSTTSLMVWHILQNLGHKTGLVSTAQLAVGNEVWINDLKMTMPGRNNLQKLFKRMVQSGCTHVVVETSSEGLAQWRHIGIPYQVAVFTNLAPEHLESHGSYENYRAAKGRLFGSLKKNNNSVAVVNLDDKEADYFLNFPASQKIGFTVNAANNKLVDAVLIAKIKEVTPRSATFVVNNLPANLSVGGEFNIENALAALGAITSLGIPLAKAISSLESFLGAPGRLEFINVGQNFKVVVDYAHTPESLEAIYKILKPEGKLIAVLGSCGGGRDKAKREVLGKLAGTYADLVFITNEDPYDEDPRIIMEAVAAGTKQAGKILGEDLWIVPERRQAIHEALSKAQANDVVIITGKGSEQWLCVAHNQKIPWDDRKVVREELNKII